MGFGTNQLSNPTPANVSRLLDIIAAMMAAIGAWIGTAGFIPANLSTILQSVCGLITTIALVIKPFFGVEITAKKVDADKVAVIETDKK